MQCGLIEYRASQERVALVFQRDGQVLKPLRPLRAQMTLDPDLIDRRLAWVGVRVKIVRPFPLLPWTLIAVCVTRSCIRSWG